MNSKHFFLAAAVGSLHIVNFFITLPVIDEIYILFLLKHIKPF